MGVNPPRRAEQALPLRLGPRLAKDRGLLGVLGALLALGGVFWGLAQVLPVGIDYYYWYWPIPRAWLAGETQLYDAASRQFFSPPWALWMLLPFSLMDMRWGMAALTLMSLAIVAGVTLGYLREAGARHPAPIVALAILCPYTLSTLFVGTLDTWSLLGIFLCYRALRGRLPWLLGVGMLLAVVRPQTAVLTVPALLLGLRGWRRGEVLRAGAVPAVVLLASFVGFGPDWPLRWWLNYFALPPAPYLVTSTYAATNFIGIPLSLVLLGSAGLSAVVLWRVWREGMTPGNLDLAVAANAIVTPYTLSQSYVVLLALPWARLAVRRGWLAALPYAISLPLLTRAGGLWDRLGLLDVTFPMVMAVLLLLEGRGSRPLGPSVEPEATLTAAKTL